MQHSTHPNCELRSQKAKHLRPPYNFTSSSDFRVSVQTASLRIQWVCEERDYTKLFHPSVLFSCTTFSSTVRWKERTCLCPSPTSPSTCCFTSLAAS
ncbi:unnamed protein product [Mycena citricolor]|uniref:Uncharacterized protein n=1 Tax=Mycena citricolor TaxID=2018698 RepID=A0AAD2K474_9AGAR|nr:unnamed protein product [Mycena citricolor]